MSDNPKKPGSDSGISRRDFLSGIASLGVLPAVAACGSSDDGNGGNPGGHDSTDAGTSSGSGPGSPDGGSGGDGSPGKSGSLTDVKHVVILMQENRSFDHYFGTMKGVRGFGDRTAITQKSGKSIFYQSDIWRLGQPLLPFHVDTTKWDSQQLSDLSHSWGDQHAAVNNGANDGWILAKGEMSMAYFTEADIPFYHALADAFTICDHYHCSVLGPTTPNRLHLWSGMLDADGKAGGPTTSNPADYKASLSWTTYPERLQQAGVTWKVYYNRETGSTPDDSYYGDYGDNPLWLFHAYHDALNNPKTKDLADRAGVFDGDWPKATGRGDDVDHVLADFIADCKTGNIPQVSFIVAPFAYSEHPEKRPAEGQAYTQAVFDALTSNPELWASTVLILNFDENDGFFDHVPPPIAPADTPGEWVQGQPVGLGPRVPLMIISPWSRGGWVNSQVFDHTSVIRFLETWTGVKEPNISAWRRSITGDLMTCFDFTTKDTSVPSLPDTGALRKLADAQGSLPKASAPFGDQPMPAQDEGTRPARALPYQPIASAAVDAAKRNVTVSMANHGTAALQLLVLDIAGSSGPQRFDVAPSGTAIVNAAWTGKYAINVHGPNRFMAQFACASSSPNVEVTPSITGSAASPKLTLTFANASSTDVTFTVKALAYGTANPQSIPVKAGGTATSEWDASASQGWYDLEATVTVDTASSADPAYLRRFTGHLENGRNAITG